MNTTNLVFPLPPTKAKGINGGVLKIIACVSMLIDHVGAILLEPHIPLEMDLGVLLSSPEYKTIFIVNLILRSIGRIAFPIFCFLLIQGFLHTKNVGKYALRLGAFALISEIPFNLAFNGKLFDFSYQNVFFTLFFGLLTIWAMQAAKKNIFLKIVAVIVGAALAMFASTDYGAFGVLMIVLLYCLRDKKVLQSVFGALFISWEFTSIFAFALIPFYNGERGIRMKYFFYVFYPAHILLLYGIGLLLA